MCLAATCTSTIFINACMILKMILLMALVLKFHQSVIQ